MILPDTSAWVEFFRGSGSDIHLAMLRALGEDRDIVTTGVVVMELLAGEPSDVDAEKTRSMLMEYPVVPAHGMRDFEEAARIYRACRAAGRTVRQLTDCLIAVAAMKADAAVLHLDRDFDVIARHTDLRIEPVGAA